MIIIYFYFVFQFYALRCYSTVTRGSSSYPVTPRLICSTKNWQQPGVLNVLNPGCSALHLYEKTKILKSLRSKVKHHGPMDSVSAKPCTLARLSENFSPLWCPCVVSNVIRKTVFHWLNHHLIGDACENDWKKCLQWILLLWAQPLQKVRKVLYGHLIFWVNKLFTMFYC